jgi:hypothetical protein
MNRFMVAGRPAAKLPLVAAIVIGILCGCVAAAPSPSPTSSPAATPSPTPSGAPTTAAPTATQRRTSIPEAGLPEGPFEFEDKGLAMTVTIPASGWTFDPQFTLLIKGGEVANLPEAGILFWSFAPGTAFYVPGDPCQATSTKPDAPATTVDDLAAALAAQASRDASEPVDVMAGGYAGKSIILHVPDDAVAVAPPRFDECEGGEFVSYGTEVDAFARTQQGPGQIDELWILDVDGAIVIIDAMARPDTSPALVEEMRSIAESATFDTP